MRTKAQHHRGRYHVLSRRMTAAARRDPGAHCWRCGQTLDRHPHHKTGKPAHWTCGHVDDPGIYARHPSPYAASIDGQLCAPEGSTCNYAAGAELGNQRAPWNHARTSRQW